MKVHYNVPGKIFFYFDVSEKQTILKYYFIFLFLSFFFLKTRSAILET